MTYDLSENKKVSYHCEVVELLSVYIAHVLCYGEVWCNTDNCIVYVSVMQYHQRQSRLSPAHPPRNT